MFATKAFLITSFILAGAKALEVSTPDNVAQCGDTTVTVTGFTGSYDLAVVPAADPCDSDSFFELVGLADSPHTFQMKVPAGVSAMIYIDTTSGEEAWSAPFTVGPGGDGCLTASPSASDSASTSPAPYAASGTPTSTKTGLVINDHPATSSTPAVSAPANAQENTPTGAAPSNAQASLFPILALVGVVAMAL